jgi:hypothetical protein
VQNPNRQRAVVRPEELSAFQSRDVRERSSVMLRSPIQRLRAERAYTPETALLDRSYSAAAALLHLIEASRQQDVRGLMHLSCSSEFSGGVFCKQMIW